MCNRRGAAGRCGARSGIAIGVRAVTRMETIGDDEVIDGMKRSRHCCATSEMPFGEEMRGKSVRLLTSKECGGDCVIRVFSDRRWRTWGKCLIDSGCLFWIVLSGVRASIGGIGLS